MDVEPVSPSRDHNHSNCPEFGGNVTSVGLLLLPSLPPPYCTSSCQPQGIINIIIVSALLQGVSGRFSYADLVLPVLFGVICLLGIAGNLTVIATVLKMSKLRRCNSVPDIYILNLSLVDLLFLLGMPFLIHQLLGKGAWRFGETLCTLITAVDSSSQFTSTYILTAMSVDRYLATVHPITSTRYRTPSVALCTVCFLWLLSLASVTPVWMYTRLIPFPGGQVGCGISLPRPEVDICWYTLYQFLLAFALPLAVIVTAYARLLQAVTSAVAPVTQRSVRLRAKKVTHTAVAICLLFFGCWAPFYTLQLLQLTVRQPTPSFHVAYNVAISLGYANSCLNPFLYLALCRTARQRMAVLFRSTQGQGRGQETRPTQHPEPIPPTPTPRAEIPKPPTPGVEHPPPSTPPDPEPQPGSNSPACPPVAKGRSSERQRQVRTRSVSRAADRIS
ncbi:melanin-concentrating hormone receptor 1 [Callorhinchus milii]|uniref:melanin-concentrating hormone receptor 1 n=1 Tax=Callorhinchus milii TaxID=7868 RepID=UPI001C3F5BFA|nr:melanin-concentrating hormone receptor 1 [Callorhinchus milii]